MKFIKKWGFLVLFLISCCIRIWLSSLSYNVDITNYLKDIEIFHNHGNIFHEQGAYNYSPLWFFIIGFIDTARLSLFPSLSFPQAIRLVLSLTDIGILLVLLPIARSMKKSAYLPLLLFFSNPVSMIISAKHGQFDNLAIFWLVLAWYSSTKKRPLWVWIFGTIALITKHIILFPLAALYLGTYGLKRGSLALVGSVSAFFITFLPYISAWRDIIQHVLLYGGVPGMYGISSILTVVYGWIVHPASLTMKSSVTGTSVSVRSLYILLTLITIFVNGIFTLWVSKKFVWKTILISILFFLLTSTGIGLQYFVLPLAFAWSENIPLTLIYSGVVTAVLLGDSGEFNLMLFSHIPWNIIWIVVAVWVILMLRPKIVLMKKQI